MAVDRRARLKPRDGAEQYVYGAQSEGQSLLNILRETNGLMWPTTPIINVTQSANYESLQPTHSIAAYNTFQSTANTEITVSGDFHVGNATDAYYLLACIHFLRVVTKMDFGRTSQTAGTPPPVLLFSAYGKFQFNDIPVIVKGTSFEYRDDVDYIQVPLESVQNFGYKNSLDPNNQFYDVFHEKENKVWVPQIMNINVLLEQQPTGNFVSREFNLNSFKRGDLLINRKGFI